MADRIGFIGLGAMGGPMAANLARKGHDMTVYDTDIAKTVPLAELGASVAGSVAELTAAVDLVIAVDGVVPRRSVDGQNGLSLELAR